MRAGQLKPHASTDGFSRLKRVLPDGILLAAAGIIALGLFLLASGPTRTPVVGSVDEVDPAQVAAVQAAWGIRIMHVAITGNGGLVDVRFQVIDPEKALGIHDPEGLPILVDEASGYALIQPGVHADHKVRDYRAGGTYYLLYQNNYGLLKPGNRVTVLIGEVKLEHVIVIQ